jgi:hypothetical protein
MKLIGVHWNNEERKFEIPPIRYKLFGSLFNSNLCAVPKIILTKQEAKERNIGKNIVGINGWLLKKGLISKDGEFLRFFKGYYCKIDGERVLVEIE